MKSLTQTKVEHLNLSKIVADENQPRKYFDPVKIKYLKDSIEKYGIMNPVTVEKIGEKYLLVDGERRFRAATELNLEEVPAIIIAPQGGIDRLIQQFHIQEQHEGWTAVEKAVTVNELAKNLSMSLTALGEMLGLSRDSITRYVSFSSLVEKKEFQKNELSLQWAIPMMAITNLVKKLYSDVLEKPFTLDVQRQIERAIIYQIKIGELKKPHDLIKLKDSFVKSPKDIEAFLEKKVTVSEMFIKTKAKPAYHFRNALNNARYASNHINRFLENPDMKIPPEDVYAFRTLKTTLAKLFTLIED